MASRSRPAEANPARIARRIALPVGSQECVRSLRLRPPQGPSGRSPPLGKFPAFENQCRPFAVHHATSLGIERSADLCRVSVTISEPSAMVPNHAGNIASRPGATHDHHIGVPRRITPAHPMRQRRNIPSAIVLSVPRASYRIPIWHAGMLGRSSTSIAGKARPSPRATSDKYRNPPASSIPKTEAGSSSSSHRSSGPPTTPRRSGSTVASGSRTSCQANSAPADAN